MRAGSAWALAGGGMAALLMVAGVLQMRRHPSPLDRVPQRPHPVGREPHASAARAAATLGSPQAFTPRTLDMVSPTTGWAVTQTRVWWTDDAGASWSNVTPAGAGTGASFSLEALGPSTAWVAVSATLELTSPTPVFFTSTHGASWHQVNVANSSGGIGALSMLSSQEGYVATEMFGAAGSESMVVDWTDNGGQSWSTLPSSISPQMAVSGTEPASAHPIPFGGDKTGMTWTTPSDGWITGGNAAGANGTAVVLRTQDGGENWYPVSLSQASGFPEMAWPPTFFGTEAGVMAVQVNVRELSIYRTDNGGNSWTPGQPLPWVQTENASLWSFADARDGLAIMMRPGPEGAGVGRATMYRTDTAGASWLPVSTNLPLTQVVALDMVTAQTGFAVTSGSISAIWETVDGGGVWHRVAR